METVKQTLLALRPKEAQQLQVAMEAFKADILEGEERLDKPVKKKTVFELNSVLAARLSKAVKSLEEIRKAANEEHHASIQHNNGLVKPITSKVNDLVKAIRSQNDVYYFEQQRIQREKDAQADRIEEGRIKAQETREAKGQKVKPVEDLAAVARQVEFKKTTSVPVKKVWLFKVTDYKKIPPEFKKPNPVDWDKAWPYWQDITLNGNKIRGTQGREEIPGLEVWPEERSY